MQMRVDVSELQNANNAAHLIIIQHLCALGQLVDPAKSVYVATVKNVEQLTVLL